MDQTIKCKDCGAEFIFTESEQLFYARKSEEMGKTWGAPKRCKDCRVVFKQKKEERERSQSQIAENY